LNYITLPLPLAADKASTIQATVLEPAVSPIFIAVAPLNICISMPYVCAVTEALKFTITNILLVADEGVIATDNPVTSAKK
jgi:hypothetical protein